MYLNIYDVYVVWVMALYRQFMYTFNVIYYIILLPNH